MKKLFTHAVYFVFGLVAVLGLTGCFESAVRITGIRIDQATVSSEISLGDFNASDLQIIVNYSDGSTQTIAVTDAMIPAEDMAKLDAAGTHTIRVRYSGQEASFEITVVESGVMTQIRAIFNLGVQSGEITVSYEEWLTSIRGTDGVGIQTAAINANGNLIITKTNGQVVDAGKVVGVAGADGKQVQFRVDAGYIQWKYTVDTTWTNLVQLSTLTGPAGPAGEAGATGATGATGAVGATGAAGLGVSTIAINASGELVITYTDTTSVNLGNVVGAAGATGATGATGAAGVGIAGVVVNATGDLMITLTNDQVINAGKVVAPAGADGVDGEDGVSVVSSLIDERGHLMLTLSSGQILDAGKVQYEYYSVVFYDHSGIPTDLQMIKEGEDAIAPADPTKVGFNFTGWDKAFTAVDKNLKVYPVFEEIIPETYLIRFMMDETNVYEDMGLIEEATNVVAPMVHPTQVGYVFVGWSETVDGTLEVAFPYEVTKAQDFYPIWDENPLENHFFLRQKSMTATTLVVEVVLGGIVDINGYDLRVNYDQSKLGVPTFVNGVANTVNATIAGQVSFNYSDALVAISQQTVLLTLTFNITGTSMSELSITVIEAYVTDAEFNPVVVVTNTTNLSVELG